MISSPHAGFFKVCRSTVTPVLRSRMSAAVPLGSLESVPEEFETMRMLLGLYVASRALNFSCEAKCCNQMVQPLTMGVLRIEIFIEELHTLYAGYTSSVCGTAKQLSLSSTTARMSIASSFSFDVLVMRVLLPANARERGMGKSANVETVACGRQSDGSRATRKRERIAGMFMWSLG